MALVVHRRRRPLILSNPRRRRRGGRRSGGGGLAGIGSSFKSLMDKQTLTIAGGAVASGFLSGYILQKFGGTQTGFSLPGSSSPYGKIFYQLAIPVGGAYLVKKYSPNLAKGMLLGGIIAAIQSGLAIAMSSTGTVAATSEYLSAMRPVGALPPGYSAVDTFGSIYSSQPAFAGSAWGN